MIEAEVSGVAVPRFPRKQVIEFAKRCVVILERMRAVPFRATELSIRFVTDSEMLSLNKMYRGKKSTTDVLTFEADDSYAPPGSKARPLGDIVISVDQARRQAREQKHSLATEVQYLVLHGVIHAYGFDHETDQGEMNALEFRARTKLGLL